MMFCPFCGKVLFENATFCSECGKKIPDFTNQNNSNLEDTAENIAEGVLENASPSGVNSAAESVAGNAASAVAQTAIPAAAAPAAASIGSSIAAGVASAAVKAVTPKPTKFIALGLIAAIVVAIGAFVLPAIFKSDEAKIEDRIEEFAEAAGDVDMEGMMACFDKKTRKTYEVSIKVTENLIGGLLGFDLPLGDLVQLSGMQYGGQDVELIVEKVEINGNTAIAYVVNPDESPEADEIYMCKEGDDWFIDFEATNGKPLDMGMGSLF